MNNPKTTPEKDVENPTETLESDKTNTDKKQQQSRLRPWMSAIMLLVLVGIVIFSVVYPVTRRNKAQANPTTVTQSDVPSNTTIRPSTFAPTTTSPTTPNPTASTGSTPSPTPKAPTTTLPAPTKAPTKAPTTLSPTKSPTKAPTTLAPTLPTSGWTQIGAPLTFASDYIPNIDEIEENIPSVKSLSLSGDGTILLARLEETFVDEVGEGSYQMDFHMFARLYRWNTNEESWRLIEWGDIEIQGGGAVVSADGSTMALGVVGGTVQVYSIGKDNESLLQLGDDILYDGGELASWFGRFLALSDDGTTLAAGIPGADRNAINDGVVRIYRLDAVSNQWTMMGQEIVGEAYTDDSGSALDLSGDGMIVAIGADGNDGSDEGYSLRGHARVYQYSIQDNEWQQLGKDIDGQGVYHKAGSSVVLSENGQLVAIAAEGADGNNCNDYGQVRVMEYHQESNEWIQRGQSMRGEDCGDYFGGSLAMSSQGDVVAIGSYWNDGMTGDSKTNSGQVKVFAFRDGMWTLVGETISGQPGDALGSAVSLDASGTALVIGSTGFYTVWGNGNTSVNDIGDIRTYQLSSDGMGI